MVDGVGTIIAKGKHGTGGMTECTANYSLDCDTANSSSEIVQEVRWVIICWDIDVEVWSAEGRI